MRVTYEALPSHLENTVPDEDVTEAPEPEVSPEPVAEPEAQPVPLADRAEPVFENEYRPTPEERADWEAWRDAKDDARRQAMHNDVADQGFPTPDPRPEIDAAQAKGSSGASQSARVDAVRAHDGHLHVTSEDTVASSDQ